MRTESARGREHGDVISWRRRQLRASGFPRSLAARLAEQRGLDLHAEGAGRGAAVSELHALLLRAARFEVARRRPNLPHLRGNELEDIAFEAANDALMSVLARLDDFRG